MQTQSYSSLYTLIEAFCGATFADIEKPKIKALFNSRAQRAYDACSYWPRWIAIGEEREVSNSIVPFTQTGLNNIGEFLRIFVSQPYLANSVQEYDYSVTSAGASLISAGLEPTAAFVTYRIEFEPNYGDGSQGETTDVPKEWGQYLAHGTYADFLRMEGQTEKAVIADAEAEDKLFYELAKPEITRTMQLIGNKVSTNLSMQPRSQFGYYAQAL